MRGVILPPTLGPLARLCDVGSVRMAGVRVLDNNGAYQLQATDGKHAAVLAGNYQNDDGPSANRDFVIPAGDWSGNFASAAKALARELPQRKVVYLSGRKNDYQWNVPAAGLQKTGPILDGRFPPVADVFRMGPPLLVVRLDARKLRLLLDTQIALGFGNVDVCLWTPERPVGLVARAREEDDRPDFFLDQLLMPLIGDPERKPARSAEVEKEPETGENGETNGNGRPH